MTQSVERYRDTYEEFSSLLAYAVRLIEAQAGQKAMADRLFYGERIFVKMVCHGLTLKRLSPSPEASREPEMWDISSSYAIARTLVETYEALAYVALDSIDATEREFRFLLWQVHAEERRLEMLRLIRSKHSEMTEVERKLHAARSAILGHPFALSVDPGVMKKIERGEAPPFHNTRAERDAASGIDNDYHRAVTMHLSSHVHTHPFSVQQLLSFQAGDPECLRLMSIPLQYSCGFLAKAIPGMIDLFGPRSPQVSEPLGRALAVWNQGLATGFKSAC